MIWSISYGDSKRPGVRKSLDIYMDISRTEGKRRHSHELELFQVYNTCGDRLPGDLSKGW